VVRAFRTHKKRATSEVREVVMNRVLEVTDTTFERTVLKAGLPVLVNFWSPWSERREFVAKALEGLAERFQDKLRVAMVNVEENRDVTRALRIAVYPTLALFMGDRVVDMRAGALPELQVDALVEQGLLHAA
jgi:thioredoxin 1